MKQFQQFYIRLQKHNNYGILGNFTIGYLDTTISDISYDGKDAAGHMYMVCLTLYLTDGHVVLSRNSSENGVDLLLCIGMSEYLLSVFS